MYQNRHQPGNSLRGNDRARAPGAQGEQDRKGAPPFVSSRQSNYTIPPVGISDQREQALLANNRKLLGRIMELEALAAQGGELPPAIAQAMHAKDERISQLEAQLREVRNFFMSKLPTGDIASWFRLRFYLAENELPEDEQGRKHICLETIARRYGGSSDTLGKDFAKFARIGLVDKASQTQRLPNGKVRTDLFIAPIEDNARAVHRLSLLEAGNNHGGLRYPCPKCGTDMQVRKLLVCPSCDHSELMRSEETTEPQVAAPLIEITEPQVAVRFTETLEVQEGEKEAHVLGVPSQIETPVPLFLPALPSPALDTLTDEELKGRVADLLVSLNMGEATHRWMHETEKGRYTTVRRPLSRAWAMEHVEGKETRGLVARPNAKTTCALGCDGDTPERAARLKRCARLLARAGWLVLLSTSPFFAKHPGAVHLWVLFDGEVNTRAALAEAYRIAPELKQELECYPIKIGMRLFAGRYRAAGLASWPTLESANTGQKAQYGRELWRLVLSHVNSPSCIPNTLIDESAPAPKTVTVTAGASAGFYKWFAAQHPLDEILPLDTNGYAPANWRGERTASVFYRFDGRWYDNGNYGAWPSTGDAYDLWVLTHCEVTPETFAAVKRAEYQHWQETYNRALPIGLHSVL